MKEIIDQEKSIRLLIILIILFSILTLVVYLNYTQDVDEDISQNLSRDSDDPLFIIMKYITRLGSGFFLLPASILVIVFFYFKDETLLPVFFGGMMLSVVPVYRIMKFLLSRSRPDLNYFYAVGYSYPSGHAVGSFTFFVGLYVFYQLLYKREHNIPLLVSSLLFTSFIGLSRVILGVHYLTDIIGGFLLSGILIISFTLLYERSHVAIKNHD